MRNYLSKLRFRLDDFIICTVAYIVLIYLGMPLLVAMIVAAAATIIVTFIWDVRHALMMLAFGELSGIMMRRWCFDHIPYWGKTVLAIQRRAAHHAHIVAAELTKQR